MGWVPTFAISCENSRAPHIFKESDIPTALMLFNLQKSDKSEIFKAPSQIEYCV